MADLLVCSEEMMEESPDVSSELKKRSLYNKMVPPEVVINHKELIAFPDDNLRQHDQVISMMLVNEKEAARYDYSAISLQPDLTPGMLEEVGMWMFEVCEEEKLHTAVFLRACQYFNKFLSEQEISRTQLQLLGAVCLFISSKIAGTTISPDNLAAYTANSVNTDMIREWEHLVLGVLKWDMYGIVATDFVQYILDLLPRKLWDSAIVYEKIKTFNAYCAIHTEFREGLPSLVASASIVAAVMPLCNQEILEKVLSIIQRTVNLDADEVLGWVNKMTNKVKLGTYYN